jgi:chemotaxis protein methyltransferase CheR
VTKPDSAADDGPREFTFSDDDFNALRALVHQVTGISLAENKRNLVYGRLSRRLRALRLGSFVEYRRLLESDPEGAERVEFVNAITTNLTSFFREKHHFEYLREKRLATLASAKPGHRFRIWSAGCSTGEEPYSIAVTVRETLGENPRVDLKILATDLDSDVLSRAKSGVYSADHVKGISPAQLAKYFDTSQGKHVVKPSVSRLITFKQLNLMHELPMRGPLDVIFCRNVVIYFDRDTQNMIWQRLTRLLPDKGVLYIGHSERVSGPASAMLTADGITSYRKSGGVRT